MSENLGILKIAKEETEMATFVGWQRLHAGRPRYFKVPLSRPNTALHQNALARITLMV